MPTTNPVPSQDPSDLLFNAGKLDEVVSGSNATYTDRLGISRRTMVGIDAAADLVLGGLGYAPPAAYAAGIALTLTTQTVEYSGEAYAPKLSALPFTTSGTFETAKFRLIQGVASADLPALVGQDLQDYAALRAYTGRAKRIYITGLLATAKPAGIAGTFQHDPTDTTSADNGGTIIVGTDGRRWKRDFVGSIHMSWFLVTGISDESEKFVAAAAAGRKVVIDSGLTIQISNTTIATDLELIIEAGATLRHISSGHSFMLKSTASLFVSGPGTIDCNRVAQLARPDAILFDGAALSVEKIKFTGSVRNAIYCANATSFCNIVGNSFSDMAEHGGTTGLDTRAIYCGNAPVVLIEGNKFSAEAPSVFGRAPGGIQIAVTDASLYSDSCRIIGNHFYKIGQDAASNFLGCVDLYTNAKTTVVSGNICISSAYIALKLQNASGVTCIGNTIRGYSGNTALSRPMIVHEYGRNVAYKNYGSSINGNVVDLTGDTTQICIQLAGDPVSASYPIDNAVVDGNVCIGGARGVVLYSIGDCVISNNSIKDSAQSIRLVAMNDIGSEISIIGNNMKSATHGVFSSGSSLAGLSINIIGNIFSDIATTSILLASDATRYIASANINANIFNNVSSSSSNITITYCTNAVVSNNCGSAAIPVSFSNVTNYRESGNSWNAGGSFTLSAAATKVVSDKSVTTTSRILLTPTNASAASLMNGAKSLYISAKTSGASFTVATADGTNAAGTETFDYVVVN